MNFTQKLQLIQFYYMKLKIEIYNSQDKNLKISELNTFWIFKKFENQILS